MNEAENPIELFGKWYEEAIARDEHEPSAVVLATATKEGVPSARVMLLKGFDERGFRVFTNLTGRKGRELLDNPNAALCFYWDKLDKQVRIEGAVERVEGHEADEYFASRSRTSQIGAWASKQSQPMENEGDLQKRVEELEGDFEGGEVPRPPFWDGFRVLPKVIEFWEKRDFRLHKRTVYTKDIDVWNVETLYP